jgi:BirA family biotin operon repressor/biotin-[acetyl-CoA-carboxylase] ligase
VTAPVAQPIVTRPIVAQPFITRRERFAVVGSTNDVVRGWLAAREPEVCLAVADEQIAGRGREGRSWTAPPGRALLLSLGFRPTWLAPGHAWRLAAVVSVAMAEAGELAATLAPGSIRLKWPNDLVVEDGPDGSIRKLAGVLGETGGLGTGDPLAVVGIGINADWPPEAFPSELAATMTSLRAAAGHRIDTASLLDGFLDRLRPRFEALRQGAFDPGEWRDRQVTTGRVVRVNERDREAVVARAIGVDTETGALLVEDPSSAEGRRSVFTGDVVHARLEPGV